MKMLCASSLLCAGLSLAASPARADGIDRDSLLSDAPAVPKRGTIRISGGAVSTSSDQGVGGTKGQTNVTGTIAWTLVQNLSADVGAYWQVGANGPTARVRYQLFSQERAGFDASAGMRFKTVGFHPDKGEVEFLLAAGRRIGALELVVNGVFGVETGGENGKDVEVKSFAGWRFNEALRAGLDGRVQAEIEDEKAPAAGAPAKIGRDYDLTAGPALSWMIMRNVQVQGLVGVAQPRRTDRTAAVGIFSASVDF